MEPCRWPAAKSRVTPRKGLKIRSVCPCPSYQLWDGPEWKVGLGKSRRLLFPYSLWSSHDEKKCGPGLQDDVLVTLSPISWAQLLIYHIWVSKQWTRNTGVLQAHTHTHTPVVHTRISSGSQFQMSDVYSTQLHTEASVLVRCSAIWRAPARCACFWCLCLCRCLSTSHPAEAGVCAWSRYIKPHSWKIISDAKFCSQALGKDYLSCDASLQSGRSQCHLQARVGNSHSDISINEIAHTC